MTKALLSLGANTPDKKERLALIIDAIAQITRIEAPSQQNPMPMHWW